MSPTELTNTLATSQIDTISALIKDGMSDKEIANKLTEIKEINLIYDDIFWEDIDIERIRKDHCFAPRGMISCPNCKNNIKEKALVCRFCKKELNRAKESVLEEEVIIPQSSIQKFSILGLLVSFSLIFHMIFCEWKDNEGGYGYGDFGKSIIFPFNEDTGFGVYTDSLLNGNVMLGLILGVLLPIVLIGLSIYLYTGWQKDIKPILKKYGI